MVTLWILGDQLSAQWPAWLQARGLHAGNARLLLIESRAKLRSRPWHRHKLTLVLSAMRHFTQAMRDAGWQVDHRQAATFEAGLRDHCAQHAPDRIVVMRPSTWQGAQFVQRMAGALPAPIEALPNVMFLASPEDLGNARSPVMETFHRKMRRRTGYLMEGSKGDQPAGGQWNFDEQNRQPPPKALRKQPRAAFAPLPLSFMPDAITQQVIDDVAQIDTAWGNGDGFALAVTREDALRCLDDFVRHRLPQFGPYEDAMVAGEPVLFHSLLSPLLNIGLLGRDEVCAAAEQAWREGRAPLNSVEGFIRQDPRLARVHLCHLLARDAGAARDEHAEGHAPAAGVLLERADRHGVPARVRPGRVGSRLHAPHPAPDGAEQLCHARRRAAAARSTSGSSRPTSTRMTGW